MLSTLPETNLNFYVTFTMSSANAFNLDQSTISSFGIELKATFQLSSAASLNLGKSQNGVLGNRLNVLSMEGQSDILLYLFKHMLLIAQHWAIKKLFDGAQV